jgi:hypothetical protein
VGYPAVAFAALAPFFAPFLAHFEKERPTNGALNATKNRPPAAGSGMG